MSERRIRVLQVAATSTGGVGLLLWYLASGLDQRRFEVGVAFGRGYLLDARFDQAEIPIIALPLGRGLNPLGALRALVRLYRLLRVGDYDIVQSHTSVGGLVARLAAWAAGVPCSVWTVHLWGSHPGLGPLMYRAVLAVERALDRITDRYVAVSRDLKASGLSKRILREEKVVVIPNGIDLDELDRLARSTDVRLDKAAYGFPPGTLLIGTVTRLEPQKAIDHFLRAAAQVAAERPDCGFVIAGDGPLRASLEGLAERLGLSGRVRFLGWREDAFAIIRTLDVFCMSSLWEGCPMVLLEAMAAARPIVATRIGGVAEIVLDQDTGLLVPPGEPSRLAEALRGLLESDAWRERLGQAGRRRVETHFGLPVMIQAYERFYEGLVAESAARSA